MNKQSFLFEVGTEVCHKVGGIYTILQSKLEQTIKNFGDNYILIGPWRGKNLNKDLIESPIPILEKAKKLLAEKGISCYTGYWNTKTKPKVILIKFKRRYKIANLLDSLENSFDVDQSHIDIDYIRSILFSAAAGETIEILAKNKLIKNKNIIAHMHEWMCGAGLLHLNKHCKNVKTIFTTHATVFGRALAYDNTLIENLPKKFNIDKEARKNKYVVFAKHSLEKATANKADYFTTVSDITATEAKFILGRRPDKVVHNGLDIKQTLEKADPSKIQKTRKKLLQIASKVVGKKIASNALIWLTSGRYEVHNKGYDVLLKSLAGLEKKLSGDSPAIVVFFLIGLNSHTKKDSLLDISPSKLPEQKNAFKIATHKLSNPNKNTIIKLCDKLKLKNSSKKIHVVFSDAYLDGDDGVFDLVYEQILTSSNLSIFPSFYEPWGYTPLESLAYSVPTITSDLAGFGCWINNEAKADYPDAAFVLKRKNVNETRVVTDLKNYLAETIKKSSDKKHIAEIKEKSFQIANLADWKNFYQGYLEAYSKVLKH